MLLAADGSRGIFVINVLLSSSRSSPASDTCPLPRTDDRGGPSDHTRTRLLDRRQFLAAAAAFAASHLVLYAP